jgi:hypothetical protein
MQQAAKNRLFLQFQVTPKLTPENLLSTLLEELALRCRTLFESDERRKTVDPFP